MPPRKEMHRIPPTELDADSDADQLGKFEGDMATARMAVKHGRRKDPTSESDPTAEPEPVVPKPKRKDRRRRAANATVKAVAAARAPITKRPASAKAEAKAPTAKRPASIIKRPAAAPAKLDKFNIDDWMIDDWMEWNASRVEARNEPRRHNFLSRVHHRAIKAGFKPGQGILGLQGLVRGKAAKIWDSVHNVG